MGQMLPGRLPWGSIPTRVATSPTRALVLACLLGSLAQARSRAEDDWQFWLDVDASGAWNDRVSVHTKQGMRWQDDAGDLSVYIADFGIRGKLTQWLALGAFFRGQFTEMDEEGTWLGEKRPYGDATLKWKCRDVQFSARNRFEYRMREDRKDEVRYRFKLTELYSKELTALGLRPYMAQELFVDESGPFFDEENRARFFIGVRGDPEDRFRYLGLRAKENRRFKSDLYFMFQTESRNDRRTDTCVLGMKIGVFF
jgi:hypothetical protein